MWAIVLHNKVHKHIEKFGKLEGRYGAERYMKRMKKRFKHRTDIVIEMISLTMAYPPDEEQKQRKGWWWCPYCRKYRRFKQDSFLNMKRCPVCEVGEREFHVKQYNNLWYKVEKVRRNVKPSRKNNY